MRRGGGRRRDAVDVGRPGGAVEQRDPVEEKGGGERAEQEIFHRRLAGLPAALEQPRQDVERERHQLDGEEDHDEVAGRGQEQHARRREEHQRVVLTRLHAAATQIVDRQQHDQRRPVADDDVEEERIVVEDHHVAEAPSAAAPRRQRGQQRGHHAEKGDGGQVDLARPRRQQVEEEHQAAGAHHDERRGQDGQRDGRRGNHRSATLALDWTCAIRASTVASVGPVNTVG